MNELCAKASANAKGSTEPPEKTDGETDQSTGTDSKTSNNGSRSELNASISSQRQKRHLRFVYQTNTQREENYATPSLETKTPEWKRKYENGAHSQYPVNGNTQTKKDPIGIASNTYHNAIISRKSTGDYPTRLSQRLIANSVPVPLSLSSPHIRKRSVNGHHPRPRQAQQRGGISNNSGGGSGSVTTVGKTDDTSENDVSNTLDGFHHPHVHNANLESGLNPTHHQHPFDDGDDGFNTHYQKLGHEDTFDPFVFDPDQSFSPILDTSEYT